MKDRIVFTGGGSAGHVSVNLALIPHFLREGWEVHYIGSHTGIEKDLIARLPEVHYHPISTGKLRRYRSMENVKDPFRTLKGIGQAYHLIRRIKPAVIFSKGGFVSVPVVIAGRLKGVPVVIHESDLTPGLANRISIPFANRVCTTFPETLEQLPAAKSRCVGAIVRPELLKGRIERGYRFSGLEPGLPVLLIMGGSLGAKKINDAVRGALTPLLSGFQIVHLTGKGQVDHSLHRYGYVQFEYVNEELPDLLAMADLVVSRAGSNSIFEFLALRKPMVLIPLPKGASRGDQILNAQSFEKSGYASVLPEEDLTPEALQARVESVWNERDTYRANMESYHADSALDQVRELIMEAAHK
ncbi:undecaprenyldiphospho-muramoylpentapeptide beta-N-acetylglucosaminyltransferase [Gorillibacterium timonense]|uniref:undecaprenyldiphospho-muramoylpentapeptide beta-N-acetylglucosaminyltransferase n=1 Tax=Gorillibacterium timonense TaxID=1689269 RepID=UPI00071C42AE|nr:undecaprenyldiphospho-muramoylpentapeptide beta-N-acetylglucosaminyltransferase [Gorillibacterium timonense]